METDGQEAEEVQHGLAEEVECRDCGRWVRKIDARHGAGVWSCREYQGCWHAKSKRIAQQSNKRRTPTR